MKKQQLFNETRAYEEREKYSKKEIFTTCSHLFSKTKYLNAKAEHSIPVQKYDRCGIIPQLSVIWYAFNYRLSFFRYETNEYEKITTFSSKVQFVDIFIPKKGIFNEKIYYCIVVFTESQVIIYGIDNKTKALINTNYVCAVSSKPICHIINNGNIFIGCENGNVYSVIYKSLDSWSFNMMYLYNPDSSYISCLVPTSLKRKKPRIKCMSAKKNFMVTLGKVLSIYNIEDGIYKTREIPIYKDYVNVQIVEVKHGEIFFYCVSSDGSRDFFDSKQILTKKNPFDECDDVKIKTTEKKLIILQKNQYKGTILQFISFNEFQSINIDRNKPSENLETLILSDDILDCFFCNNETTLYLLANRKIIFYEIMDIKKYVLISRADDVYNMIKNIGQREALVLYFNLLSLNSDISKMEFLSVKVDENHLKSLFSFIYRELKSFLYLPLKEILKCDNMKNELELKVIKFKNLYKKIKKHELNVATDILNYFVQTVFFINLLDEYSLNFESITLLDLLFDNSANFKKNSLDELMEIFKMNKSIDMLINSLNAKAPDYLPIDEIYRHKGLNLLKKYPSRDKLWESLKNFKHISFNLDVIEKYNDLKFYSGSIILIRKHFNFNFEKEVLLLKNAIHCDGAISSALEDSREEFHFAFFEALTQNLLEKDINNKCACCDTKTYFKLTEIIKLDSKFLSSFLKEKSKFDTNSKLYELYWKYCAYRNDRINAVKSLIYLIDEKSISQEKKIDLLRKCKTISLYTEYQEMVSKRVKLLDIQLELINRGENSKMLKNMLLKADTLLNDYAYKYPDLALRIIDIYNLKDKNAIKETWIKALDCDLKKSLQFIVMNNFSGNAFDIEILGNIFLEKMTKNDSLSHLLYSVGFSFYDIQKFIENKIHMESDLETRNWFLDDFQNFSNDKKSICRLEQTCISKS